MEAIESIVALIVTISILVTIHEYGHYWVARRCGVKVLRFSIGFGKPLFTWHGKPACVPAIPAGLMLVVVRGCGTSSGVNAETGE